MKHNNSSCEREKNVEVILNSMSTFGNLKAPLETAYNL